MNKNIFLIGLSHHCADVSIREKFALAHHENIEKYFHDSCCLDETVVISTCNRVEIIAISNKKSFKELEESILSAWAKLCNQELSVLKKSVYVHINLEAVSHLFRVAASLDSLVMGEPQILGQLKTAYKTAVATNTTKIILNRLLHKSFSAAKRVRTETQIASNAVSISYAAVELAKNILGSLTGKKALLIGAGEMAELAITHLLNNGLTEITIVNRTKERAENLAEKFSGTAASFDELSNVLENIDVVISSTGATEPVLTKNIVKDVMKKRKNTPMFFIDIAVPRDIDKDVHTVDNVYLYDIDDLQEMVASNIKNRKEEALKAEKIITHEVFRFNNWLCSLEVQPTIVALLEQGELIAQQELAKTLRKLQTKDEKTIQALEQLVSSISKKILHNPVDFLKRRAPEPDAKEYFVTIARRIFNLDNEAIDETAHKDRKTKIADELAHEKKERKITDESMQQVRETKIIDDSSHQIRERKITDETIH